MPLIFLITLLALLLAPPALAATGDRVALLIGNSAYPDSIGALKNPHNDVTAIAASLRSVGFKTTVLQDATLGRMQFAINRYVRRLRRAGDDAVGFFYYSGHGAADQGTKTNYLIPIDAKPMNSIELWDSSIPLFQIKQMLSQQAPDANHFVVFDACRNELRLIDPDSKSILATKGFVPERAVNGMLIAYATEQGQTASDIGATAGPFAAALADEIKKPGVEVISMFRNVQLRVQRTTGQNPWLAYGALRPFYFMPNGSGQRESRPTPAADTVKPSPWQRQVELTYWNAARESRDPQLLRAYINRFPNGAFVELARVLLEKRQPHASTGAVPHETNTSSDPTHKHDQARVASLPPAVGREDRSVSSPSAGPPPVRRIQALLKKLGCYSGRIDGLWGPASRSALHASLGSQAAGTAPTQDNLDRLTDKGARCAEPKSPRTLRTQNPSSDRANHENLPTSTRHLTRILAPGLRLTRRRWRRRGRRRWWWGRRRRRRWLVKDSASADSTTRLQRQPMYQVP